MCWPSRPYLPPPRTGRASGRLQGKVEDENGDPVEGATVTLLKNDLGPEPLTTNKKGRWSYLGLRGGTWTVQIESDGFIPSEGAVSVTEFGVNPSVDIQLRPHPRGGAQGGRGPAVSRAAGQGQ